MTDYFAVMGLPRRPVIDEKLLQDSYLRLAAKWHPDAAGGSTEKFRDLQEARRTLLDPASRLRHLLEVEGFESQGGGSHGSPELFLEVAGALEAVKGIRTRIAEARSAIGRAAIEPERHLAEQRILHMSEQVSLAWEEALKQLENENAFWPSSDLSRLEGIRKKLVFLSRWRKELRESLFCVQNSSKP